MTNDKPTSPARRRFLRGVAGMAIVGIPTCAYGHYVGANDIEVVRTDIHVPNWPRGSAPLRIGFLSDFHCDSEEAVERAGRAADIVMAQSPDLVLLGGDYLTIHAHRWTDKMALAISSVANAPLGAIGVLGNHDWWCGQPAMIASRLTEAGICMISNRSVQVSRHASVFVIGVEDAIVGRDDVAKALVGVPESTVRILLIHEPDVADRMPPGFALQLSGHSHAGQVRIFGQPIITPEYSYKYKQGLMQTKNHPIYVTRGIGMVQPAIRLDCAPEVSVITLSG